MDDFLQRAEQRVKPVIVDERPKYHFLPNNYGIDYTEQTPDYEDLPKWRKYISEYLKPVRQPKTPYGFTGSPYRDRLLLEVAKRNEFYAAALETDHTEFFLEDLLFRMTKEKNLILTIYGETGSGKSSMAQSLYCFLTGYVNKHFNARLNETIDDVVFTGADLLKRLSEARQYQTIINDEDENRVTGTGSVREREEKMRAEEQMRGLQINTVNCSPRPRYHVSHFVIEAINIDYNNHLNRGFIMENGVPVAVIMLPERLVEAYKEKKKAHLSKLQARDTINAYDEIKELARKFWDSHEEFHELKKEELELMVKEKHQNLTSGEKKDILKYCWMFKRGII